MVACSLMSQAKIRHLTIREFSENNDTNKHTHAHPHASLRSLYRAAASRVNNTSNFYFMFV